jgi:hypothetical protein
MQPGCQQFALGEFRLLNPAGRVNEPETAKTIEDLLSVRLGFRPGNSSLRKSHWLRKAIKQLKSRLIDDYAPAGA